MCGCKQRRAAWMEQRAAAGVNGPGGCGRGFGPGQGPPWARRRSSGPFGRWAAAPRNNDTYVGDLDSPTRQFPHDRTDTKNVDEKETLKTNGGSSSSPLAQGAQQKEDGGRGSSFPVRPFSRWRADSLVRSDEETAFDGRNRDSSASQLPRYTSGVPGGGAQVVSHDQTAGNRETLPPTYDAATGF